MRRSSTARAHPVCRLTLTSGVTQLLHSVEFHLYPPLQTMRLVMLGSGRARKPGLGSGRGGLGSYEILSPTCPSGSGPGRVGLGLKPRPVIKNGLNAAQDRHNIRLLKPSSHQDFLWTHTPLHLRISSMDALCVALCPYSDKSEIPESNQTHRRHTVSSLLQCAVWHRHCCYVQPIYLSPPFVIATFYSRPEDVFCTI